MDERYCSKATQVDSFELSFSDLSIPKRSNNILINQATAARAAREMTKVLKARLASDFASTKTANFNRLIIPEQTGLPVWRQRFGTNRGRLLVPESARCSELFMAERQLPAQGMLAPKNCKGVCDWVLGVS